MRLVRPFPPLFEAFVAPARAYPQIWRLFLGVILSALIYALGILLIFTGVWLAVGRGSGLGWIDDILRADTPFAMFVLLGTFLGMALGPMVAARLLHKRKGRTLFGPRARTLRDFAIGAGVTLPVLGLSLVFWSFANDTVPGLPLDLWLMVLPLALLGVLIQTGAEELLFRGYLQQQLAARFRSPLLWAVLPAAIFGLVHYDPDSAGQNVWLVVAAAGTFGLIAADLTQKSGSIGAAWGFHFANNAYALTLIATQGTLTGLALRQTPYDVSDVAVMRAAIPWDLAVMVVVWLVIRRLVGR